MVDRPPSYSAFPSTYLGGFISCIIRHFLKRNDWEDHHLRKELSESGGHLISNTGQSCIGSLRPDQSMIRVRTRIASLQDRIELQSPLHLHFAVTVLIIALES